MSTTISPCQVMTSRPVSVTSPMTVAGTSHLAQTSRNAADPGRLDDRHHALLRLAHQDLGRSQRRVAQRHRVQVDGMPPVPAAASSVVAHATPAAPRSWMPATRPAAKSSRQHSISSFSVNGSPTWTLGRLAASAVAAERRAGQHRGTADAVGAGRRRRTGSPCCRARGPRRA